MFENLKAFIRHGKQAGDLGKLNHGHHNSHNPGQHEYSTQETAINGVENVDGAKLSKIASGTKTKHNYEAAATQIVEQELKQKKNHNYPGLEDYQILDRMGEGAFSVVYKAKDTTSDQLVAIKILRKFQMDSLAKKSVLKEVTIMKQLDNPNVVRFIKFIESVDYYYIVQELVPGGEIFTAIVKYTYFSENLSRHIITQVALAVKYLHEEIGIVHRDIKPENLLFVPIDHVPSETPVLRRSDDPNKLDEGIFVPGLGSGGVGLVKLADFGLSKQIWSLNTKTPCGTVGYTAPEIVKDERYSKEVDMWAMGCVLYTLLCGFPPFYDERIELLTEKVALGQFTFLTPWWDEISNEAKFCVTKLLTVDPLKRYTINDLLNDPWIKKDNPLLDGLFKYPVNKFSKNYKMANNDLYSPALVSMRDAFDISTNIHRMGEEAIYKDYIVEEEEEEDDESTITEASKPPKPSVPADLNNDFFDLSLNRSTILERRKHNNGKQLVGVPT